MRKLLLASLLALTACGGGVRSEEDARLAYLGLDKSIDRALNLGMAGFNAASSANIPPQSGNGEVSGSMTVNGQVDQGASANKGMRLSVALSDYADTLPEDVKDRKVTYNTDPAALPALTLSLRDIPNGTFTGTMTGKFLMSGALDGEVSLNLSFSGRIEPVAGSTEDIQRVPGSMTVTGTAESAAGTFEVNLTR